MYSPTTPNGRRGVYIIIGGKYPVERAVGIEAVYIIVIRTKIHSPITVHRNRADNAFGFDQIAPGERPI
jgi:hypothetical protein